MSDGFYPLAFIGPGGPELMVVMLVLLMLFGAKDAPRILRKLNEIMSHIRNTADGFKREVMYGDIGHDSSPDPDEYRADYGHDEEESSTEVLQSLEEQPPENEVAEEGDDAQKT
jgi:Sec-independent protein translocase protein TatA